MCEAAIRYYLKVSPHGTAHESSSPEGAPKKEGDKR